ncbi:HIT-like domain-containing protein [Obelidium mucronatum]|nr:HIT-like domain-containing protein [Obelidium mucronatum]
MQQFKFGPHTITANEIFYSTRTTFGLVNLKPVTPGHVLLIPRRVVARYSELTAAEASDLALAAQRVGGVVEREFGGAALTLTLQDGAAAGQSVAHVHWHLLPRRARDWPLNDHVYAAVDAAERAMFVDADAERKPRTPQEMAEEAARLRPFFAQISIDEGGASIWDDL